MCFFAQTKKEILGLVFVAITVAIHQVLLVAFVGTLLDPDKAKKEAKVPVLLMILKMAFLGIGLVFGVQIMGKRIILAVFNYIAQLSALCVSLKKNSSS
jgi:phosphate/sulfate permease